MKLAQINTVCNTSTGKIMGNIQLEAEKRGIETLSIVGRRKTYRDLNCEKYGNYVSFWIHVFINTLFDKQGYGSYFETKRIVRRLKEFQPDIIHLHNLHGYCFNLPVLFHYLTYEYKGRIFWTFHDCWPITGHCAHFSSISCQKWENMCYNCPKKKEYPISLFADSSRSNYRKKKRWFTQLNNLTVIVPSEWMANWVRSSFLRNVSLEIIFNGIDLEQFKYAPDESVLQKYQIPAEKKIILGVASVWSVRKGLKDFLSLSEILPTEYQIVLVGLSSLQIKKLPTNIKGIKHTDVIEELTALYSGAFVFLNPSVEESFSLVTVEAMACGTPVVVLDNSAVKELVNENNGIVLHEHTAFDYLEAIDKIKTMGSHRGEIRKTAYKYDAAVMSKKIVDLYVSPESNMIKGKVK